MKQKINWLLILQGWTMLWVVVGHSPLDLATMSGYVKVLYTIAYSFHMPLFFMISGFLFYMTRLQWYNTAGKKSLGYGYILIDKLKRLGIPFIVFTIIAMFLKTAFAADMARASEISVGEFINAIIYPSNGPLMELWFVAVLFWMFALTPLWKVILENNTLTVITSVILLILYFVPVDIKLLCMHKVADEAIWFFMGMIICKNNYIVYLQERRYLFLLLGLILWVLGFYVNISIVQIIGGIVTSTSLAFVLDCFVPKIFFTFRNYTYQIFLIGIFAQILVKMLYRRVDMPYLIAFIICTLAGLYVPVIVSKIVEKINWYPLLLSVGLSKKK